MEISSNELCNLLYTECKFDCLLKLVVVSYMLIYMNNNLYNSLDEGRHWKGKMKNQRRVTASEKLRENRHLVERREERRVVIQDPKVERELLIKPLKCAKHWG